MKNKNRAGLSAGMAAAVTWFGFHCGSGFATGRQMVQFTTRHGWAGVWIPVAIWAILGVFAYLSAEFTYLTHSKNYKEFTAGFFAPIGNVIVFIWDAIVALGVFVAMGSVIAAAGDLFVSVFGISYWAGIVLFTALLLVCIIWGYNIITKVASFVTVPMIALLILTVILGISYNFDNLKLVMSARPAIAEGSSVRAMFSDVITYVGNQANFLPSLIAISGAFACERDVRTGTFCGALLNCLMHTAMVILVFSAYPWINSESLVVLGIIDKTPYSFLKIVYQAVIFLALVSTGVTLVYGAMSRFGALGKKIMPKDNTRKIFWAAVFIVGSVIVSSFGLAAIVKTGYKITGSLRLPVMVLPIFVLAPWRIHQARSRKQAAEAAEAE